ncbi:MAG: response regulator transcription factor [Bacteroidetes bacterium]|jgi:two-component system, LytTR family, response regulator|nr:response regulator transcription factor [Bacteroidota bacterium]MBT6687278.1 response regulator transcription factor [Bacteroidota bacterium]MBT7144501.1 response regulator transcription factor [Bacteroidota bacterium]MBT7493068.1 response regulator transcription factor [Bacteroidota bacterium]
MITALIIDDEAKSRITLRNFLGKYCKNIEIVGEADGVNSGIEQINKLNPEVIFLDIHMQDGSGFDLLERITKKNFKIIFVTAYSQYAIKAFKFSAIDYLLKPYDPEELVSAVDKIKENDKYYSIDKKLETLISNRNGFNKIALPTMSGIHLVKVKDIVRCQSTSNYTNIFLNSKETILVTKTLKEYEELLSKSKFFRVHQSHLINLAYVERYIKGEGGTIIMEDGSEVEVARRRKDKFLTLLLHN